ncbi:MAG: hypothetical protein ACO1TE_05470 [Prosthecobacter sp.]
MKTLQVSLITFVVGLSAGMILPWRGAGENGGQQTASKDVQTFPAPESGSFPPRALEKTTTAAHSSTPPFTSDPFKEWTEALKAGKLTDTRLRHDLLEQMAKADPARAWQALMQSGLPVSRADIDGIASAWYEKDPADAAKFGLTLTDPLQRPAFLRQVLSKWMLEKPGAFARWFQTQPADLDLAQYLHSSNIVYRNNLCTLEDLDGLLRVNPRYSSFPDFLGRQLGALWSQPEQRQAATEWLRGVADPQMRDALWKHLVAKACQEDPQAATGMLTEISDDRARRQASSTITAHLTKRDPQAALQFAASLPDAAASQHAWQSALCTWAAQDPQQALGYIRENLARLTPQMLEPAGSALGESRPAEALALAAAFPASVERTSLINNVMSTWRHKQPSESRRWVESDQATILPAADLQHWRSSVASPQPAQGSSGMSTTINGRRLYYSY